MKKVIFALAATLLFTFAFTALANSVEYKDGQIFVSASSSGYFEIYVDGTHTYKWVGGSRPSTSFKWDLNDGEHTLTLYSSEGSGTYNIKFYVGDTTDTPASEPTFAPTDAPTDSPTAEPTVSPTAGPTGAPTVKPSDAPTVEPADKPTDAPTDAPTAEPTFSPSVEPTATPEPLPNGPVSIIYAEYSDGVLTYHVEGLRGYAEIWVDGKDTGRIVRKNGEHTFSIPLNDGEHTLSLYAPGVDEIDRYTFSCDSSVYGITVENENRESVPYQTAQGAGILIITALTDADKELSLVLPCGDLEKLAADGVVTLLYIHGRAQLRIDVGIFDSSAFGTAGGINSYAFSTLYNDGKILVNTYARSDNGDIAPEGELSGITLLGDSEKTVKQNGEY